MNAAGGLTRQETPRKMMNKPTIRKGLDWALVKLSKDCKHGSDVDIWVLFLKLSSDHRKLEYTQETTRVIIPDN